MSSKEEKRPQLLGPDGTIYSFHIDAWVPVGKVNDGDPYVEESDANPERINNGCMIYRRAGV